MWDSLLILNMEAGGLLFVNDGSLSLISFPIWGHVPKGKRLAGWTTNVVITQRTAHGKQQVSKTEIVARLENTTPKGTTVAATNS